MGGDRLGSGHIRIPYKAPEDYTKPQQTIQRNKILTNYLQKVSNELELTFVQKRMSNKNIAGRLRLANMAWGYQY